MEHLSNTNDLVISEKKGCPMTVSNCKKYGVTDEQIERFCHAGCSVICYEEFMKKFGGNNNEKSVLHETE